MAGCQGAGRAKGKSGADKVRMLLISNRKPSEEVMLKASKGLLSPSKGEYAGDSKSWMRSSPPMTPTQVLPDSCRSALDAFTPGLFLGREPNRLELQHPKRPLAHLTDVW